MLSLGIHCAKDFFVCAPMLDIVRGSCSVLVRRGGCAFVVFAEQFLWTGLAGRCGVWALDRVPFKSLRRKSEEPHAMV